MAIFLPKNSFSVPIFSFLFPSISIHSFHHFKGLFLCLLLLMWVVSVNGATRNATVSGNWSNSATWGNNPVPTIGDVVVIKSGILVTMDVNPGNCNDLTINGTLTNTDFNNLNVYGNWVNNGTFNGGAGTVTLNSLTSKTIGGSNTSIFNNLTLAYQSIYSLAFNQTVNGVLYINNNTMLKLGIFNLTLGTSASIGNMSNMGNSCMIVANQSGKVQKKITSSNTNVPFTFPIGDIASGSGYTPITLNFTSGTYAVGAFVSVNLTSTKHNQNFSPAYLSRYWTVDGQGISSFSCNVSGTFDWGVNINGHGDWSKMNTAEYVGSSWINYSSISANSFTANGVTAFGDFTAMGLPSFTTNNSNLSELNYSSGSGPSGNLSVYVTGLNITTGVIVTPPADFEICLTSGGTYQLAPLTIPGSANNIPFFVRLKAGLKPGIYNNETIVCTSNGATPVNITVSGTVYASNFYSQASGNWNSNTTWSNNYYGGPTAPLGAYPLEGDNVFIENDYIVTVNVNSACATLNGSLYKSGTLMFGGPYTLNVSGKVQLGGSGDINQKGSIKFANGSTLNADNLTFGGTAPGIINMTSGGILNISSLNVNTITGNNWTPGTGTVIMNATNTLPATLFTTFNNLTFNAGTTTATTALTILGNLNLNTGATFEGGAFTHNIAGNWTNNGGRFTPGTGTTNFTGSSSSINGSTNTQIFNNIIVAKNPGTSLSYAGNTNLTLNGDLTLSTGTFTLGATLIVSGNWLNNGGVFNPGTGIVTLNGSGKNIGGLNATTFNNLTIASPGNINVMKSVSISGLLTMASGLLSTSTTHLLSITNTSPTAISGGSVTSFINGPVSWSLPTISSAITYNFPVGKGTTYLPFSLINPTTTGATKIQVEAFDAGVTGSADGTTLNLLSNTEYWSWKTNANFTSGSVSLNTPLKAINPLNAIGSSTTSNGSYTTLWGTTGTNDISNSKAIGGPNRFFVMATKTLPIQPPGLGYASAFAVFTEVGAISISGATVINGNLGTNSGAVTGLDYATISGSTHIADTYTLQAAADLTIAYNQFDKLGGTVLLNALGNGQVLMPGIYQTTNASTINGNLTLDAQNDPNALFIIRIGGAMAGADVKITLANSANINNIYWQVNGAFSLVGSSNFSGNIIANGAIAIAGNSTVLGNILTITGAITIDASVVKNDGLDHKYILIENNLICSAQTIHSGSTPTKLTGTLPMGGNNYVYSWESSTTNGVTGFTPITINGNTQDYSPGVLTQTSWYRRIVTSGIYFNTSPAVMITVLEKAPIITPPVLGSAAGFSIFTITGEITNTGYSIITGNVGTNHSLHPINGFPPGIITGGSIHNADAVTSQATADLCTANSYLASLHGTVLDVTLGNGQILTSGIWDTGGAATLNGELILDAQGDPNAIFIIICSGAVTSTQSSIKLVNTANINNVYWYIKGAFTLAPNSVFKGTAIVTGAITLNSNSILLGSYLSTAGTILINNNAISNDNLLNRFIINGNWSNSNNWSTNVVPISSDNLKISATAKIDDDISCCNLTIDLNGSVTISPEKSLTLSGNMTNNAGASGLIIKADPLLANGSLIFHNESTQPVNATVEMYSKASWDLSESIPAGSKYKWQFFGIPFRSLKASPAFDGAYVRRWNEKGNDTNYWLQLSNDSVLTKFTGYEITQSTAKIYSLTGELVNDNFPVNLSYTIGAYSAGQNILCNPYTAAIDISKIMFGNNTENSIYFYNTGTYNDWNSTITPLGDGAGQYNVSPTQLSGTGEIPGQIPSMQGFLVKATGAGSSITIPYSTAVKNTGRQRITPVIHSVSTDKVFTKIDIKGSRFSDRMWIFSSPECTPLFDNGWDGYKIKGSIQAPQLYVAGVDGDYQVNAVKDMNGTLLYFQKGEDSEYTLTFTHGNIPALYSSVFLIDLLENKTIDVTANASTYSFIGEPTPGAAKRFKIITIPIEKDEPAVQTMVKICCSGNTLIVQNLSSLKGEIAIYDMMGRNIRKSEFIPSGTTAFQLGSITGAYVVKAFTSNVSESRRIIVGKE